MTPAYEKLRHIALLDEGLPSTTNNAFWGIRKAGINPSSAMTHLADVLCSRYGLSGEVHKDAIVLYSSVSRAKHPACIVISMDVGQRPSPSASIVRRTGHALIQVFEGDADDTEMAGDCQEPTHRLETKGRVLLH